MFVSEYLLTWISAIHCVANTLKNIYLSTTILNDLTTTYYDDTDGYFGIFFQSSTDSSVNIIYRSDLIQ